MAVVIEMLQLDEHTPRHLLIAEIELLRRQVAELSRIKGLLFVATKRLAELVRHPGDRDARLCAQTFIEENPVVG